ncbi:GNAT family N-acetyltransferase [bacterium]|nr:GNAT family N-acetyltransferase [bacterium]
MRIEDYDDVRAVWEQSLNRPLDGSDSRECIVTYLSRNPRMSMVARHKGRVIGAALCGHDGHRGWLYHVAVDRLWRRHGVASAMIEACADRLAEEGILKCHLFVLRENGVGHAFWESQGWAIRSDVDLMTKDMG